MHRHLLTAAGVTLVTLLTLLSWAHPSSALTLPGSPTAVSASLLYIYAADPKYWPGRMGKLLRDNDTLLIVKGFVYKVWCEVLPEGKPRIDSNNRNVIAHRPTPIRSTIAHVELRRTLFDSLNAMDSAGLSLPKLWCDYTDGVKNMRTEVHLRAFSIANTTCDYTSISGLVVEGNEVSFSCEALSGYPIPKHMCDIVRYDGLRLPIRVKSAIRLGASHVVTTFSVVANQENHGSSIECSTSQQITYDGSGRSFDESHTEKVPQLGNASFTFVLESNKNCEMNLAAGSSSLVVRCQSTGGLPETEHSCHVTGPSAATSVPLMTRISEGTANITEATFSNLRADKKVSVTCILKQGIFYRKNFTFPLPVIANTTCDFAAVNGLIIEGHLVNFTCTSLSGYPVPQHRCDILNDAGTARVSAQVLAVSNYDDQVVTTFSMLASRANQGAGIDCSTNQRWVSFQDGRSFNQLHTQTIEALVRSNFTFVRESTKGCGIATASADGIKIQCQSSGGLPETEHTCSYTRANESGILQLISKSPKVSDAHVSEMTFDNTKSHLDTTITCVLKQQSFHSKNIVFQIPGAWNTACDFASLTGLVTKGSLVNFTCTSRAGYSSPEHKCDIVRLGGAGRVPAQVTSSSRLGSSLVVTRFSFIASLENQGASIECNTSQPISYYSNGRTFKESFAKKVRSIGRSNLEFISPSSKQCEMIMTGDYGITIRCRSRGGKPQAEHSCLLDVAYLPIMAKFEDGTYITETAFNNSWAHQNATVTCTLRQLTYFSQNFTFPIPKFKQSTKTCQFVHLIDGLQATCSSGTGWPSSEHSCIVQSEKATVVLKQTEATVQNGTVSSTYKVPNDLLIRGSHIVCAIRQMEFPPEIFVHSVPRFIESSKSCNFTNSIREVKVVCELSHGYPVTHSECQLKTSNSSADIRIDPDKHSEEVLSAAVYTVKLQEPEVSPQGGSIITCRLYQGHLFAKTFVHEIGKYISLPPEPTKAPPELLASNQTILTLTLVLVAVLLLVLTLSLPIHLVCKYLRRRNHKATAGILEESLTTTASVITTAAPVTRRPRIPTAGACHQSHEQNIALMQAVLSDYGFRGNRRAGIPDIDQYSMLELGLEMEAGGSKRKSVLVDPLLQSLVDKNKKEFRFSM